MLENESLEQQREKTCINCGTILEDGLKFCRSCGTKVEDTPEQTSSPDDNQETQKLKDQNVLCPSCGEEVEKGLMFCTSCGMKISVEKTHESSTSDIKPPEPNAETFEVTDHKKLNDDEQSADSQQNIDPEN